MKKRKVRSANLSIVGAIAFFVLVATLMQIAILVYDYICTKTDDVALIAVLILILIIILSVFCTLFDWVRRKIMTEKPTVEILDATNKIAEGDFSVRLTPKHEYAKYDQYDLIKENLNKMASELQKTEVLKVDFISNVSHEIKTPLSVIQNYAMLMQDENLDSETRKEYADTLLRASKRVTDLITNILKLNKLENQTIQEKKETFSLTESLSECVIGFESLMEKKNIEPVCDFEDIEVYSFKSLTEIVWNNLLSNAVKFTGEGGKIFVSLKKEDDCAVVTVTDTGCGISPEVGARIFEKFYQGDTSRSVEGNGLGLTLVKKVVGVVGGEISVSSELGKGSTFTVKLKCEIDE